jgi:hypothetical protein
MTTTYLRVPPDDELESSANWQNLGDNTYSAVQADLVVIKRREQKVLTGPPIDIVNVPGGSEYTLQDKRATVVKHVDEIQDSIQETVSSKFSAEIVTKIASEVGATGVLPSAKLSSEVQGKAGTELREAVQNSLTRKRSFEIQDSQEITRSVTHKPSADGLPRAPLTLRFYLGLWPWRWEFYLYSVRYLRLRYARNWLWSKVRKTISESVVEPKLPLFCVRFYQPQDKYSFTDREYVPDVADEDDMHEVKLIGVDGRMPNVRWPSAPTLEDLARLAFPVTQEERTRAKGRARARKVAAGKLKKARGWGGGKALVKKRRKAAVTKAGRKAKAKRVTRKRVAKRAARKRRSSRRKGRR